MHIQNVFRNGGIMAGLICLLTVQIVYAGADSTETEAEGLVWPEVSTQAFQSGQSAFEVLPVAQADPDSDFGEDVNVNMTTIHTMPRLLSKENSLILFSRRVWTFCLPRLKA